MTNELNQQASLTRYMIQRSTYLSIIQNWIASIQIKYPRCTIEQKVGTYYWRFDCYWYAHSLPDPVGSWFEFELIIERVWYGDTEYLGLRPRIEITRETRGVGRKFDRGDFRLFWIETSSVASVLKLPRCLIGLMCSLCCISWLKGCSFLTSLW